MGAPKKQHPRSCSAIVAAGLSAGQFFSTPPKPATKPATAPVDFKPGQGSGLGLGLVQGWDYGFGRGQRGSGPTRKFGIYQVARHECGRIAALRNALRIEEPLHKSLTIRIFHLKQHYETMYYCMRMM